MKPEDRYDSLIVWYSLKYGRDPRQVKRQLRTESWFNPRAKNKKTGAMGLAQFMMPTWREWHDCTPGIEAEPQPGDEWNPEKAIAAHCSYMKWLQWFLGEKHATESALKAALAGYVWGPGNVKKCMEEHDEGWLVKAPKDVRDYVSKCMGYVGEVI